MYFRNKILFRKWDLKKSSSVWIYEFIQSSSTCFYCFFPLEFYLDMIYLPTKLIYMNVFLDSVLFNIFGYIFSFAGNFLMLWNNLIFIV